MAKKSQPTRGLGRGLSALMSDVVIDEPVAETRDSKSSRDNNESISPDGMSHVAMDQLCRNPDQPRRHFDPERLQELTDSIKDKGVLQPVLVRPLPDGVQSDLRDKHNKPIFQIIAGERRWQAALKAGLDAMPVFIRDITDQEALEIGIVENVHRADLNPMEEALAYKSLLTQFKRTQEDVAEAVGKSRSYIANMLRLLNLPDKVQDYLATGKITTGHARAIIAAPDPSSLADEIVKKDLSVRAAEDWVRRIKAETEEGTPKQSSQKSADARRVEAEIIDALGLAVDLRHKGPGGELRIRYRDSDQFDELLRRLVSKPG